jgi:putative DNA primase/helicase
MKKNIKDPKTLIEEAKAKHLGEKKASYREVLVQIIAGLGKVDITALIHKGIESKRRKIQALEAELNQKESSDEQGSIQRQVDLLTAEIDKAKVYQYQLLVRCTEQVIEKIDQLGYGICHYQGGVYLYNGAFWELTEKGIIQNFLGKAAEKLGIERDKSRYFQFKEKLYDQLRSGVTQMVPETDETVSVNLQNGTYDIDRSRRGLRAFSKVDFLRYELPFSFNSEATAPQFQSFLDKVLPDPDCQMILAEYIGYIFIKGHVLKLEKVLLLYGSGANGKSVVFDVVGALVGDENISHYSLQSLCDQTGHNRANLANKLLNYSSELNGDLSADKFKQLASGEPIEARHLYSAPFILKDYGKLMFNCNELPWKVEHTHGFYRRFLILPFEVIIPKAEQDKHLAGKIIANELPGVFNWAMQGLERLLKQQEFTDSEAANQILRQFKVESDTVQLFLQDKGQVPSTVKYATLKDTYAEYRSYCGEDGYQPVNNKTFKKRLKTIGFAVQRKNFGWVVYLEKETVVFNDSLSTLPSL